MAGRDEKRKEEHWGCDGNVNYIDYGGDFTNVYLCHYYCIESESEVAQQCPTLCDPIDCTLPGSSVHGIFQARVLEWVAIAFSINHPDSLAGAAKSLQSCPTLCDPIDGSPPGSPSLGFSRQEHWSGLPFPSPMHESEK